MENLMLPSFKKLVDETEAAHLLGISVKTLQNQRYYGQGLPFVKIRRMIRYKLSDIEVYAAERTVQPYAVSYRMQP